uniref:Endonuclease MutS2 n=1 Tax=candidate division WOR-3 bacterium TaxID=2052148 RepID=A0A7C4CCQ7_UNCW3
MDRHTLEVLDFPRIQEMLAGMCATELGRAQARDMLPLDNRVAVARELDLVQEAVGLPTEPMLCNIKDIRGVVGQAVAGAVLTATELVEIRKTCEGIRVARDFLKRCSAQARSLCALAQDLDIESQLEDDIMRAIDDSGAVRDSANPRLQELRAEQRRRRNALVERMERVVEENPRWFEGGVAVRGERFVIPVRAEERNRVPGVVHASSGSGHTLFVEPFDTVAEQNELQELRDAEKEEIQRILRRLSGLVAAHADVLIRALEAAARLDVLVAKRRFALRFNCTRPNVAEGCRVELLQARHPLLLDRNLEVVPLNFRLPESTNVVVVSGPNAGGKTVVLKTVGLFSVLVACGMFIPASAGTQLPLFTEVFADIGDEQSLERALSSFTAHLVRLRDIVARAEAGSLVLLDEIGASTDPEEGAALAAAVLEILRDRGALTLATTHLSGLKRMAQCESGMVNAAVEFRNGPTYRLVMGAPGESSALAIAERAGLQKEVIARARTRVGTEWLDMTARLAELNAELEQAARARAVAERIQKDAEQLRESYEKRVAEFERTAAEQLQRARAEQAKLLIEARREIENLVRRIREQQATHESVVAAKRFVENKLSEVVEVAEPVVEPATTRLAAGDIVESATFHRRGTVVEVGEADVLVGFGQVKVRVPIADLVPASAEESHRARDVTEGDVEFETRLDVRGLNCEEAKEALCRFLDDAVMTGAVELRVLHGKGTGALRRALWERLRRDARVERVWLGEEAEGGSGVTFVRLRGEV